MGVTLPDTPITVVHRSAGSGTTYIWTDYLAKVSPDWKSKPGVGTLIEWPTGTGKAGNVGVADKIKTTAGVLGATSRWITRCDNLGIGLAKNQEDKAIKADAASVTAAVKSSLADIPADLTISLTNAAGDDAYPIVGTVWAIVDAKKPGNSKALADFLRWATHEGQAFSPRAFITPPCRPSRPHRQEADQLAAP